MKMSHSSGHIICAFHKVQKKISEYVTHDVTGMSPESDKCQTCVMSLPLPSVTFSWSSVVGTCNRPCSLRLRCHSQSGLRQSLRTHSSMRLSKISWVGLCLCLVLLAMGVESKGTLYVDNIYSSSESTISVDNLSSDDGTVNGLSTTRK